MAGSITLTVFDNVFGTYTRVGKLATTGLNSLGRSAEYISFGSVTAGIPGIVVSVVFGEVLAEVVGFDDGADMDILVETDGLDEVLVAPQAAIPSISGNEIPMEKDLRINHQVIPRSWSLINSWPLYLR